MRFWKEKNGVSVIIGTLIIFTIMTGLYASVQVTQVPAWNRNLEAESFETTYGDMVSLKSDISDVAAVLQPKSADVSMGTRYPDRMIFTSGTKGIAGSLTTENFTVTVTYTIDFPGDPTTTENYTSSRLIYETRGSVGAKIIYEHGLLIKEFASGTAVSTDTQELIVGDDLFVPVLNASLFTPISSVGSESLTLKPFTASNTLTQLKSVTITLPTAYPEVWADRLDGLDTAKTTITVNQTAKQIVITSTAIKLNTSPAGAVTGSGLYAGMVNFSTKSTSGFDPDTDFPRIFSVEFQAIGSGTYKKTHTTLQATVMNATAPYDIHADLTDLTSDVLQYDEGPTYSSPDDITSTSWGVPNTNTVKWEDITHPEFAAGEPVAITFWVFNRVLNQQYSMTAITVRLSGDNWR